MIKVLLNLGKIIALIRVIKQGVADVQSSRSVSRETILSFLSVIQDLLASRVVDIPNVDEDQLVVVIEEVKNQWTA